MIEFLEDLIDADPSAEFPRDEVKDGTFVPRTGDAVADAWFKDVAEGRTPDFMASFDAEDQAKLAAIMKPKQAAAQATKAAEVEMPAVDEWRDDYTRGDP